MSKLQAKYKYAYSCNNGVSIIYFLFRWMLKMIIVLFFVPVLLSCLPFLHSATYGNTSMPVVCPTNFTCPALAQFKYPFYSAATDTKCGLIKVNCTKKRREIYIQEQPYVILEKFDSGSSMVIFNRTFDQLIKTNKTCEVLVDNITSPSPLLYSISIDPFITLFKCPNNLTYDQQIHAYFDQRKYNCYNSCKNHSFYYKYLVGNATVPYDLPHTCQVIQLPVKQRWQFYPVQPDETNISSLLASGFSITFQLSTSCEKCHKKGGQCNTNNGNFMCLEPNLQGKGKPNRKLMLELSLGVATLCVGAVTTLIIISCFKRKFRLRRKAKWNVKFETFLNNNEFLAPKRYSYSQVQKITNSFKVKLGQGGFGYVYKGSLSNGNLVAVKVLSELKGIGEDFINEVASVGRTSHVNIVSLVGFCLESRQRALIYEFMPNGSLEKFIYDRGSSSISQLGWENLHQIAIGIARGLEYLHWGCNTWILHFDIKPHNILLDQDFCPKISDFGLSKLLPEEKSIISMSCMRGTPGYIAPELFSRNFGPVSHKSDVYSYGMMILEMVGGRRNVKTEVDHTSEIYFPHWIYKKIELDEEQLGLHGIVSDEENEMARKMIIVGLWCIQTNPLNRPTITKVLEMLEGGLKLLELPPKPYMCSP